MPAYYNEHDPKAAAWLRELIARGLVAPGDVDDRSIVDVRPADLAGYTQCHFFAGIGVWSYALRSAGWADDAPVWTGSCPCQPFSASGKSEGTDDPRHLWPAWFRLIRECRPHVVFGEQVAAAAGLVWLDLVSADLEGTGYAVGAADLCAAGVGAPHIRQRLYFVADARSDGTRERSRVVSRDESEHAIRTEIGDHASEREAPHDFGGSGALGNPGGSRLQGREQRAARHRDGNGSQAHGSTREPGRALGGFWRDADWIPCRDGKARPVEPGTFPLAHGAPARVVRLRGYGNAVVAPQAQAFIEAYLDLD